MRAALVPIALFACDPSNAVCECDLAAAAFVKTSDVDHRGPVRANFAKRCIVDKWNVEMRRCLMTVKTRDAVWQCDRHLTDHQREQLYTALESLPSASEEP